MTDRDTPVLPDVDVMQDARTRRVRGPIELGRPDGRFGSRRLDSNAQVANTGAQSNTAEAIFRRYRPPSRERRAPYRVAKELRARIESGHYRYGDWLPTEQALLFELPVGRSALRESMIILECQGLIESHPGIGNRIVCPDPLMRELIAGRVDCIAMLEACRFFETEAAALASCHDSKVRVEPPREQAHTPLEEGRRFHIALADATGNGAVAASIRNLWDLAHKRSEIGVVLNAALAQSDGSFSEQRRLVIDAVHNGNPEDARELMRALFNSYLDGVLNVEEHERVSQARSLGHTRRLDWRRRLAHQNQGLWASSQDRSRCEQDFGR